MWKCKKCGGEIGFIGYIDYPFPDKICLKCGNRSSDVEKIANWDETKGKIYDSEKYSDLKNKKM